MWAITNPLHSLPQDFTSDFYFRQAWRDSRLAFMRRPGIDALYVGAEVSDKIWVPDTFFANEKSAQFHKATTFNTFIRIRYNGEVLRSIRYSFQMDCHFLMSLDIHSDLRSPLRVQWTYNTFQWIARPVPSKLKAVSHHYFILLKIVIHRISG